MLGKLVTKFVKTEKTHTVEVSDTPNTWFLTATLPVFGVIRVEHKDGTIVPQECIKLDDMHENRINIVHFNVVRSADDYFIMQYIPNLPADPVACLLAAALLSVKMSPEPVPNLARACGHRDDVRSMQAMAKTMVVKNPVPVSDYLITAVVAMNDRQVQVINSLNNTNAIVHELIKDVTVVKHLLTLGASDTVDKKFKEYVKKASEVLESYTNAPGAKENNTSAGSEDAPKAKPAKKRKK